MLAAVVTRCNTDVFRRASRLRAVVGYGAGEATPRPRRAERFGQACAYCDRFRPPGLSR
jgi:hypothetical protein